MTPPLQSPSTPNLPFAAVLVANRGEIAVRLVRGVQQLGLHAVAVYTEDDANAAHVRAADAAVAVPSYMDIPALVAAAKESSCGCVLPGYGFVSENADAVRAFTEADIVWAGPRSEVIEVFGGKVGARAAAQRAGVPTVPGSPVLESSAEALAAAKTVGFPCLVKASAGGGGMGQAVCYGESMVERAFDMVVDMGKNLFGSGEVYIERYVAEARHVEVQVFGDGCGTVVALGTRDCSVQRRRQKVIEEAGAGVVDPKLAKQLRDAAVRLCSGERYGSAGTVEFIVDVSSGEWFFLEVNTRLQVEHCVTEMVAGVDLVRWMVLQAGGVDVLEGGSVAFEERGCAIEARVYAENPVKDYAPCPGVLSEMIWPSEGPQSPHGAVVRVDAWARRGTTVSSNYDPLLGKIIVWGVTRGVALRGMAAALEATVVRGVATNVELLLQVLQEESFASGNYSTSVLDGMDIRSRSIEVVTPGLQTSLQDFPGRLGYWSIGVSPSGAMDSYAMGIANALVGNPLGAAAAEITLIGPTLCFHTDATIALTGARLHAELDDGKPIPWWTPFQVEKGSVLSIEGNSGEELENDEAGSSAGGKLAYLAVRGGFDAPDYLGSKSTFPTGNFGGIHGGFLKAGDFLPVGDPGGPSLASGWPLGEPAPSWLIPEYGSEITVGALNGPHGSQDFLQEASLDAIWNSEYKVHHAANRLGVRLIGPTPKWTRDDGGSAGLHPSNLHDYTYAPGAVNFSGNTPIVLMMDGPSLGGFVCPITISSADLWKVAQARPGTVIRFKQVPYDDSRSAVSGMRAAWDAVRFGDVEGLRLVAKTWELTWAGSVDAVDLPAVAASLDPAVGDKAEIKVMYRMSGDEHVLVEYGEIELDLAYRMRVHMLMEELKQEAYVLELCPGVRSLLIKYDPEKIHVNVLVETLKNLEVGVMGSVESVVVPSRVIRLPLAFNDKWCEEAQQRYLRSVRPDAPYMPSNVEFVRRINGLSSVEEVKKIMTECEYCIMGLGDVYLSAPCALPIDPRHRLVTSKYNPARTYTPEGAVGIGGAYMCIYGMDSPGGYQLCGRTLPIWDNYGDVPQENRSAPPSQPWYLRFFDRVTYYPVSDDELEELRAKYRRGDLKIEVRDENFSFKEYLEFCEEHKESISAFTNKRHAAFIEERGRWEESGEAESDAAAKHAAAGASGADGEGEDSLKGSETEKIPFSVPVLAGVSASVWNIDVSNGDVVERGQTLVTLESMKVEISIEAPVAGVVQRIQVQKGDSVGPGDEICLVVSSQQKATAELGIDHLRRMYKLGLISPESVVTGIVSSAKSEDSGFAEVADLSLSTSRAGELAVARKTRHLPLFGIPFVTSEEFGVVGSSGHSGALQKEISAPKLTDSTAGIVSALEAAGAICVGKVIAGQNSSPAAFALKNSQATFAVVLDSAGDNVGKSDMEEAGLVGLRVTEGLLSLAGVSRRSPLLDSLVILGTCASDVKTVLKVCARSRCMNDDRALRTLPIPDLPFPKSRSPVRSFTIGLPSTPCGLTPSSLDSEAEADFHSAVQRLIQCGGKAVEIDCDVFKNAAKILEGIRPHSQPVMEEALAKPSSGDNHDSSVTLSSLSAVAEGDESSTVVRMEELENLRIAYRSADALVWAKASAIAVPSRCLAHTSRSMSEPSVLATADIPVDARFIAAMDFCCLTLGCVTLVAPAFHEANLLDIAERWELRS